MKCRRASSNAASAALFKNRRTFNAFFWIFCPEATNNTKLLVHDSYCGMQFLIMSIKAKSRSVSSGRKKFQSSSIFLVQALNWMQKCGNILGGLGSETIALAHSYIVVCSAKKIFYPNFLPTCVCYHFMRGKKEFLEAILYWP
jgi:hypothetical protein